MLDDSLMEAMDEASTYDADKIIEGYQAALAQINAAMLRAHEVHIRNPFEGMTFPPECPPPKLPTIVSYPFAHMHRSNEIPEFLEALQKEFNKSESGDKAAQPDVED